MHKAGSFIKCQHCKSVHVGAGLFTLEGIEANPTIHPRNSVTQFYSKAENYQLVGYSVSNWCGDIDGWKSASGYVFFMGGIAFTWLSKKQLIVMLSTCEAKYVATFWCVCHAIFLRNLLSKMKLKQLDASVIHVNNKSAIELAKNPVNYKRSKRVDARFHFIRDHEKEVWNWCM